MLQIGRGLRGVPLGRPAPTGWWAGVVFLRRFLVTACVTAFPFESRAGLVALFATLMAAAVVQAVARPFVRQRDNYLDIATMLVLTKPESATCSKIELRNIIVKKQLESSSG